MNVEMAEGYRCRFVHAHQVRFCNDPSIRCRRKEVICQDLGELSASMLGVSNIPAPIEVRNLLFVLSRGPFAYSFPGTPPRHHFSWRVVASRGIA
jgi:hypothetical protein